MHDVEVGKFVTNLGLGRIAFPRGFESKGGRPDEIVCQGHLVHGVVEALAERIFFQFLFNRGESRPGIFFGLTDVLAARSSGAKQALLPGSRFL